ncbi:MAG: hypothetical protein ACRDTD_26995, partial [Pseudonocardiaceae bacterium]
VTQILDIPAASEGGGHPLSGAQRAAAGFVAGLPGATIGGAFTPGTFASRSGSASPINDVDPVRFDEGT